jgi:hypothetical protein
MISLNTETNDMLSLAEAEARFRVLYHSVDDMTKVKLKCWLYYCESRAKGGKLCIPFGVYIFHMGEADYLSMVRGYTVDCSDIGGIKKVSDVIACFYNEAC